jgi:hypothetical protein
MPTNSSNRTILQRLKTKEEVEVYFPGFLSFVDCTEQPIPGSEKRLRRRLYYSGKRKKHTTVKNLYTTNQKGLIIYKIKHRRIEKKHDYKVYKDNHPKLPEDLVSLFDLGFPGVEREYPEQRSLLPVKKEKDCELTVQQKMDYHKHSKRRIVIEHTICRIKKYRIMNDLFRNGLRRYDKVSDIVSRMVNYRIMNLA